MPPETSLQQLRGISASESFKLADRSAQERLKVVQSWVGAIAGQRSPDIGEAASTPGMRAIVDALQFLKFNGKGVSSAYEELQPSTL